MSQNADILVIDDEAGIRAGCKRALGPAGYRVQTASTLEEALQHLRQAHFDAVLLDVMMPDGSGIAFLETIQELDPDTVVVIITGYATVELAITAIKRGAYDFISKPFSADVLLMTADQALEKRRLTLEARRLQAVEREAKELAREKEEMERLDRFKTTFMLTVAHELRSPVASAQSLTRALFKGLAGTLNEKQRDIISRVEVQLEMLMALIDDLLDLAATKDALPQPPLEPISLAQVLKEVLSQFEAPAQEKRIAVDVDIKTGGLWVKADEEGLRKVLTNLISNAVKYTPAGGRVHVSATADDGEVRIHVKDTGIGIPASAIPMLGQEFFRAPNAKEADIRGTGLGLSIVKGQLDRFQGRMQVQSELGQGSEFTVQIPSVEPDND
jgi:two-component system sensor histidine kinase/response regulator